MGLCSRRPRCTAFTLVEVLCIIGIIVVGIALTLPAIRSSPHAARRNICQNNLKKLVVGMQGYAFEHGGRLPPAYTTDAEGKPLHSWRALILPYIEQRELADSIDFTKPWDDPANAHALNAMPPVYACPAATDLENRTTYLAIVSPGSVIQPTEGRLLNDVHDPDATLLLLDVDAEHAVPWMAPRDADDELIGRQGRAGSVHSHTDVGMLGAFATGHGKLIADDMSPEAFRAIISIADEPVGEAVAE